MQIIFNLPSKSAPGFAKRQRRVLELQKEKENPSPELVDKLVEFLADYVQAETHEQAVAMMWEASEEQWNEMLEALGGGQSQIPPLKSANSESP